MKDCIKDKPLAITWGDIFGVYGIVYVLVVLDVFAWKLGFSIAENVLWACVLLASFGLPMACVRRRREDDFQAGIAFQFRFRDCIWGIAAMAILVVPIVLGYHWLQTVWLGNEHSLSLSNYQQLQTPLIEEIFIQFLCVALPEEFLYRGFIQTCVEKKLRLIPKFASSRFLPVFVVVLPALLFALVHLPNGGAVRLLTFFPGCLFGFLRLKSGSIASPVIAHALCNLIAISF